MSYSRWGGSNWYSYAGAEGLWAHYCEGKSYCFTEAELRDGVEACMSQVEDGNEHDKKELREIIAEYLAECDEGEIG